VYLALSYLHVAPSAVDDYAAARRDVINPALAQQPGFAASFLLRPRDGHDPLRLALLDSWSSRDDLRRWVGSPLHDEVHGRVADVVQGMERRFYQRLDDASIQVGAPETATMWSIGTHRVVAGRGPDYLASRRQVSNPDFEKAAGFVGYAVHAVPGDENRFLNVFQWENDAAADDYYASPSHVDVVYQAVAQHLTEQPLPTPRYDLLVAYSRDG
jgi:heme-degrading monooxygenase HmoA